MGEQGYIRKIKWGQLRIQKYDQNGGYAICSEHQALLWQKKRSRGILRKTAVRKSYVLNFNDG
jgi:hypothetical protein